MTRFKARALLVERIPPHIVRLPLEYELFPFGGLYSHSNQPIYELNLSFFLFCHLVTRDPPGDHRLKLKEKHYSAEATPKEG